MWIDRSIDQSKRTRTVLTFLTFLCRASKRRDDEKESPRIDDEKEVEEESPRIEESAIDKSKRKKATRTVATTSDAARPTARQ